MNILRSIGRMYTGFVNKNPIISQAVQVSILMGAGDVIAQRYVEKTPFKQLDKVRTLQFCGMGLFIIGPCLRVWYGVLDRMFIAEKAGLKQATKKMCVDQFIFAPIFIGVFTTSISLIQGYNTEQIKKRLEKDYLDIVLTNYKVWPAAQMINFTFVPLNYQVLFAQFVAILWNTYLSNKLKSERQEVILDKTSL